MGYTGERGKPFRANSIKGIATRKLYIGILESRLTDKVIHRPDLQIVDIAQFKRVQQMIKRRSGRSRKPGQRGKYPLTGFVVCGNCGGPMVAGNRSDGGGVIYQCSNFRTFGKAGCNPSKTYSQHLILPPIIEKLTNIMQSHLDLRAEAHKAAAQFGKSIIEEAHEAGVHGELESVRAGMKRLVDGVALGVFKAENIAASVAELQEREKDLLVELARLAGKTAMHEQWQVALDSFEGLQTNEEISGRLHFLAGDDPIAFRLFLSLVFEPNSLLVSTSRIGKREWTGILEDCQLTAAMNELRQDMLSSINQPLH